MERQRGDGSAARTEKRLQKGCMIYPSLQVTKTPFVFICPYFFISDTSCPHMPVGAMLILFWPPGVPQVALIKIGPLVSERLGGRNSFSLSSSHFMA